MSRPSTARVSNSGGVALRAVAAMRMTMNSSLASHADFSAKARVMASSAGVREIALAVQRLDEAEQTLGHVLGGAIGWDQILRHGA